MLILTRKTNQEILIGENIIIKVLCLDSYQVRLGIDAPKDIPVHRLEVLMKLMMNELKASQSFSLNQSLKGEKCYA